MIRHQRTRQEKVFYPSNRKINPSGIYGIYSAQLQPIVVPRRQDNGEACGENDTALEAVVALSEVDLWPLI